MKGEKYHKLFHQYKSEQGGKKVPMTPTLKFREKSTPFSHHPQDEGEKERGLLGDFQFVSIRVGSKTHHKTPFFHGRFHQRLMWDFITTWLFLPPLTFVLQIGVERGALGFLQHRKEKRRHGLFSWVRNSSNNKVFFKFVSRQTFASWPALKILEFESNYYFLVNPFQEIRERAYIAPRP